MESLILIASGPADRSRAWLRATCGDAVAAQISRAFIEDTLQTCAAWRATRTGADFNRKVVVSIAANREGDDMPWGALADAAGARLEVRADDDVHRLCAGEFERGARAVAVIGDATPTLPAWLLDHAFLALQFEPVVVGPTVTGAAWLLGAQRHARDALTGLAWGAVTVDDVARHTAPHLLPFWCHVIDGLDVARLRWHGRALRGTEPTALAHSWVALRQAGLIDDDDDGRTIPTAPIPVPGSRAP